MGIDFTENEKSLESRIKIHDLYGSANLDEWMLEQIRPSTKDVILDLGCGDGKQCFAIENYLNKLDSQKTYILHGVDEHQNLIQKAKNKNKNKDIKFQEGSFDNKLNFESNTFDIVIASFSIYYAEDIKKTIKEIVRVLKKDGRIFFCGPMPDNKIEFNHVVEEAANKKIPKLIGSSRFSTEIFDEVRRSLSKAKINVFKNELIFDKVEPFLEYAISALEKNRNVYEDFLKGEDFEKIIENIKKILTESIKKNNLLKMTKLVGGISAVKIND